jgi:uroporphyrinogen-III synthase
MRTKTITVYADPGHAWAKVSKKELIKLGIADDISGYSYQRGDYAFLEEDSDLEKYILALRAKGIVYKFKEINANKQSRIRNYYHYIKPKDMKPRVEIARVDRITF